MMLQVSDTVASHSLNLNPTFTQLFLLGIGVAVLVAGQFSLWGYIRLLQHGRRTRGVIMAVRSSGEDREMCLRFLTHDGREINMWTSEGTGKPGDRLVITYDPAQPEHYRVGNGVPLGFLVLPLRAAGWLLTPSGCCSSSPLAPARGRAGYFLE